ncbi:MAG: DUF1990 domain-containing protein [Candidatus Xenobia bacterium]
MQFLARWQQADLASWEARQVAEAAGNPPPGARLLDYTKVVGRAGHQRLASAIMRYDIFPPSLVTPVLRRAPLQHGDTVGVRYHTPFGVDLFFAARVVATFDELQGVWWSTGFTYQTLPGHPELGQETFSADRDVTNGTVRVSLRSWSVPGIWLTKLGAPVTRAVQDAANRAAIKRLGRMAQT